MSIVSTVVTIDADRHVIERHTDHLGKEYMQTWYAPRGWTQQQIDDKAAEHASQIVVSLAEGEADTILGDA
jgi:hypothetical protein